MGKHGSDYERMDKDFYPTPFWVVDALADHIDLTGKVIWEPACGTGEMALAMMARGASYVYCTDIEDRGFGKLNELFDFTAAGAVPGVTACDMIVTNPPFGERGKLGEAFIERGLEWVKKFRASLALLLPSDFDAASTRRRFFQDCPLFVGDITLTKRIKWFDRPVKCRTCEGQGNIKGIVCLKCRGKGEKNVGPKENHKWLLWQSTALGEGQAKLKRYAPKVRAVA